MKKKWDREEDSMSLVITPHEAVILEMSLHTRVDIVNKMLYVDTVPAVHEAMLAEIADMKAMIEVLRSLQ